MKLYVGNIPFTTTEDEVRQFFRPRPVDSVVIVTDRETHRPRGFAFVELADGAEAIAALDGADLGGRRAVVSAAVEKQRTRRGGARHKAREKTTNDRRHARRNA